VKVLEPIHGATAFWNEVVPPKTCSSRGGQEIEVDPDGAPAGMTTTSGFAVI
jgi:hypothetical protein